MRGRKLFFLEFSMTDILSVYGRVKFYDVFLYNVTV